MRISVLQNPRCPAAFYKYTPKRYQSEKRFVTSRSSLALLHFPKRLTRSVSFLCFHIGKLISVLWSSVIWDFNFFHWYLWTVYILRILSFHRYFLLTIFYCFLLEFWLWYCLTNRLLCFYPSKSPSPFVLVYITFVVDIYDVCLLHIHSCYFRWWSF